MHSQGGQPLGFDAGGRRGSTDSAADDSGSGFFIGPGMDPLCIIKSKHHLAFHNHVQNALHQTDDSVVETLSLPSLSL